MYTNNDVTDVLFEYLICQEKEEKQYEKIPVDCSDCSVILQVFSEKNKNLNKENFVARHLNSCMQVSKQFRQGESFRELTIFIARGNLMQ